MKEPSRHLFFKHLSSFCHPYATELEAQAANLLLRFRSLGCRPWGLRGVCWSQRSLATAQLLTGCNSSRLMLESVAYNTQQASPASQPLQNRAWPPWLETHSGSRLSRAAHDHTSWYGPPSHRVDACPGKGPKSQLRFWSVDIYLETSIF